ncbi:unnamed protein product [Caenorhabditis brenneri]
MSLSRPATFPLLKLPFLCIEPVIKCWDILDIIFFALVSQKTRQTVKHFKIPLNGIKILVRESKWIELERESWHFKSKSSETYLREHFIVRKDPLVLQNNANPLYTIRTDHSLVSYTSGNEVNALKMAMEFLNEVFKCSVELLDIEEGDFPESFGIKSTDILSFRYRNSQPFVSAQNQKLSSLLKSLEVTDICRFWIKDIEKDFYVDPKLFKCRELVFGKRSADWVTGEILLQFEVPRLNFYDCPFSVENILSFVTQWFHSDNKKLEYLYFYTQNTQFSIENFQMDELSAVPFSGRHRVPSEDTVGYIDFSKGLEIVRHDGLQATIHVGRENFMFYIWHNQ